MNLESVAIYYDKDGKVVHKEVVNIGQSIDVDSWVTCVKKLPRVSSALMIECYEIKFPMKWVNRQHLDDLRRAYEEQTG